MPDQPKPVDQSSQLRSLPERQRLRSLRPPTGRRPVVKRPGSGWSNVGVCNRSSWLRTSSGSTHCGPASGSTYPSQTCSTANRSCAEPDSTCVLDPWHRASLDTTNRLEDVEGSTPDPPPVARLGSDLPEIITLTPLTKSLQSSMPASPFAITPQLGGQSDSDQTLRNRTANNGIKVTR